MKTVDLQKAPELVPVDNLSFQDPLQSTFEGWTEDAFKILDRLKAEPHIGQYRIERDKGLLTEFIKNPFKRYRDDLVVNWVLPSSLKFETESYVFSRLLKNDFGAGGCHHHKWLAFYRPNCRRLTDVQITHSLHPQGFDVGVFIGTRASDLFQQAKDHILGAPHTYLDLLNERLAGDSWRFYYRISSRMSNVFKAPLRDLPQNIEQANGLWLRRRCVRDDIEAMTGGDQIKFALTTVKQVWPVYRFYFRGNARSSSLRRL